MYTASCSVCPLEKRADHARERDPPMRKRKTGTASPTPPATPPQLLNVPEVARLLSIGRTKVYDLIKNEGLPSVRVGSALRVSVEDLHTWIEERTRRAS